MLRLGPVDLGAELRVQERKPWGHVALSTGLSAPHYPKPRLGRWPPFPHAARPPRRERTGSPSPGAAGAAEFRHTHELSPREAGAVASTWQIGTLRHRGVWDSAQAVGAYGPAPPVGRSAGVGGPPCLPKVASPASERAAGWDRVFRLRSRRGPRPPTALPCPPGPIPRPSPDSSLHGRYWDRDDDVPSKWPPRGARPVPLACPRPPPPRVDEPPLAAGRTPRARTRAWFPLLP